MVSARSRSVTVAVPCALAAVLLVASWWYLQQSYCVGDLKSGTGNVAEALSVENRAFYIHLAGVVLLSVAFLVHSFGRVKHFWLRAVVLLVASPALSCLTFLALALFSNRSAWVCANAL
mgnify:FL=1